MSKYKRGDILEITWADANGGCSWESDRTPAAIKVKTIGYFIAQNKEAILLATGIQPGDTDMHLGSSHIPNGMILKVRKLR